MSYSFSFTAASAHEATRQIREEFDTIVASQPSHTADKEAVIVAAQALVRLLAEPSENEELLVAVHGSLSWNYDSPEKFTAAGASIGVSLRQKGN
jgi:hypothetical protein